MKKNIITGIAIVVFVLLLSLVVLTIGITNRPEPLQLDEYADSEAILYQKDLVELDSFSNDLALSDQNSDLFLEIDQIYNDILDLNETALDENAISEEAASADFSEDLNSFNNDEAVLLEIDQSLNEVTQ